MKLCNKVKLHIKIRQLVPDHSIKLLPLKMFWIKVQQNSDSGHKDLAGKNKVHYKFMNTINK